MYNIVSTYVDRNRVSFKQYFEYCTKVKSLNQNSRLFYFKLNLRESFL